MAVVLQIGSRTITEEEIVPLLANYQLLPKLVRELLIDQVVSSVECTPEELARACQQFYEQNQITSETVRQAWLKHHGTTLEQVEILATRRLKVEKFKQITWGHKLESCFLQRKAQLDRVVYSLIRTQDFGVAQELYFRIQAQEQSFAELAREYSQGPEAQTNGLIGPIELSNSRSEIGQMLSVSQPGQLWPPTRLGDWVVIVRLEKFIPAQLDEPMRQRLLHEMFVAWLSEQLQQMNSVRTFYTTATSAT
ncbi:MAG: peptidylprolyl isomerase [Chroococcidiopsidaceae cyanobacterium CP_BM_ER_R8_30]|nr:peptidylprolyl isomerase [Chroococcidiopsidaceae cyanobacterium CP_BM_ER_R8_30]